MKKQKRTKRKPKQKRVHIVALKLPNETQLFEFRTAKLANLFIEGLMQRDPNVQFAKTIITRGGR